MIYPLHIDGRSEVCLDVRAAARWEAQGFERVTPAEYHSFWAERDRARRVDMAVEDAEEQRREKRRRDKGMY